jgi:hypothetical protein
MRASQEKGDVNQAKAETGHKEFVAKLEDDRQANMETWS